MAMSPNCRAAQGKPNREHRCTGCEDCSCHHVAPPPDFRALIKSAKTDTDEPE